MTQSDPAISEKARILLVEDNEINQEVVTELLSSIGMQSTVANDGQEALQLLDQLHFDAVLMDIQMPGIDGYETTRLIRANPSWQNLPIIAMTAHAMSGDREKSLASGMNDHLTKPIDLIELTNMLERWLPGRSENTTGAGFLVQNEPADANPEFPNLPGFDIPSGLRRMGNDPQRYRKLLLQFRNRQADTANELRAAFDAGDLIALQHLAHTLKGLAGNLSALDLQQSAAKLENCLRQENLWALDEQVAQLEFKLQTTCDVIAELATEDEVIINARAFSDLDPQEQAQLETLIQEMVGYLKASDLEAVDALETLINYINTCHLNIETRPLEHAIEEYNFESALEYLAKLTDSLHIQLQHE